jgi:hypothetical protein
VVINFLATRRISSSDVPKQTSRAERRRTATIMAEQNRSSVRGIPTAKGDVR